jgi:hypothetical protein
MSDSMSNTEIEDVLSSIRRLVTEDHRPLQRPNAPPADKLVLTPALRIEPPHPDVRPSFGAAEPLRLVVPKSDDPTDPPSHHAAAALEAALQGHREEWEPDGTEASSPSASWSVEWDATDSDVTEAHVPEQRDDGVADATRPPAPQAQSAEVPAGRRADEDDIWDDFLAEHRSAPLLAAEQAQLWRPAPRRDAERSAWEAATGEASEDGAAGLSAAARQTFGAEPTAEALSPDLDLDLDLDGEEDASPWPASAPADLPDVRLEDGVSGLAAQEDPPSLDEVLLRDLIRDVLREELQGELGERITRNVRKLVRAELARALTVRDLT